MKWSCADSHMRLQEGGWARETKASLTKLPTAEKYIFPAAAPASFEQDRMGGTGAVPQTFVHRMLAQEPEGMPGGTVRITDIRNFPAFTTIIAAALVEPEPGGLRELHWHPPGMNGSTIPRVKAG